MSTASEWVNSLGKIRSLSSSREQGFIVALYPHSISKILCHVSGVLCMYLLRLSMDTDLVSNCALLMTSTGRKVKLPTIM